MNQTTLKLLYIDSPDTRALYFQDVSWYNPDVTSSNPILEITPPNFSTVYVMEYPLRSLINLSSNTFQWTNTTNYEELTTLPDGLWAIKQFVTNAKSVVHKHFRIVNLKGKIMQDVSKQLDIDNKICDTGSAWFANVFRLLQLLEHAKYMAENCGLCDQAIVIYNQVEIEAAQIDCDC
jgi:hypothetical protein